MAFTALDVKKLREMTNVGMMDCKKALQATDGDMDAAVDWLREKGLAKAAKKADRVAAEGVAYAAVVNGIGVVIEVNSETDFAAKTDAFMDLVKNLATVVATENPADVDALKACKYPGSNLTVTEIMQEKVMSIGENMQIRRFAQAEGTPPAALHYKDLVLSPETFSVTCQGQPVGMTRQEFRILELLLSHPGRVFSKQAIYDYAWDEMYLGEDKTINVHISNIRKKLRAVSDQEYIETVWGVGFRLAP